MQEPTVYIVIYRSPHLKPIQYSRDCKTVGLLTNYKLETVLEKCFISSDLKLLMSSALLN